MQYPSCFFLSLSKGGGQVSSTKHQVKLYSGRDAFISLSFFPLLLSCFNYAIHINFTPSHFFLFESGCRGAGLLLEDATDSIKEGRSSLSADKLQHTFFLPGSGSSPMNISFIAATCGFD